MEKAKYSAGLNDFSYCASLHISHPSIDPVEISNVIGLQPTRSTQEGQPHRSVPDRNYDFSHWACELQTVNSEDIPTFLQRLVDLLSPYQSYLKQLSNDGAEIECFIGVFATRLCDQAYRHDLLASLAALRVGLRFDLYPSGSREAECE